MRKRWYILYEFPNGMQVCETVKGSLNVHEALFAANAKSGLPMSKVISIVRR
jgi:hypothetical protein